MESAYSILMFIFGGMLALYGLACVITQNYHILPIRGRMAAKGWNTKRHVKRLGVMILLVSIAPIASGVCGLIWEVDDYFIAPIVLFVGFIVLLIVGANWYYKNIDDKTE